MMERRLSGKGRGWRILIVLAFLLYSHLWMANAYSSVGNSSAVSHKMLTPHHISPTLAKQYLNQLNMGTVSQLPDINGLFITAEPSELAMAAGLVDAVDTTEPYTICALNVTGYTQGLRKKIAIIFPEMAVGTFTQQPSQDGHAVIIDEYKGRAWLIAPTRYMNLIKPLCEQQVKQPAVTHSALEMVSSSLSTEPQRLAAVPETDSPDLQSLSAFAPGQSSSGRISGSAGTSLPGSPITQSNETDQAYTSDGPGGFISSPLPDYTRDSNQVDSYQSPELPNGEQALNLNLPEKLTIIDLLGLVGEYLHLDFMYDPQEVQGEVTLKLQGELRGQMKVKHLYPLLESVLKFKGFVMTRKENLVTIVPAAKALEIDPELREGGGIVEHGNVIITREFKLEYIDTESAKNLLTSMKLGVEIVTIPETKTLIVTEFAYRMERIGLLLEMVDQPGEPKQFRYRQLQYTMAANLVDKVRSLAEQLASVEVSISEGEAETAQPTRPSARRPGESQAQYTARLARERRAAAARARARASTRTTTSTTKTTEQNAVYLDADERTNRILMIGLKEQLDLVEDLVDSLDVAQTDLRSLQIYPILFVDARDARDKLAELGIIGMTYDYESSRSSGGRITGETTPGATPSPRGQTGRVSSTTRFPTEEGEFQPPLLEEPQVVVIESTNSLLVNATPEQHTQISHILTYVDAEATDESIPYEIYALENQEPEELAGILEKLIQETIKDKEGKIETVVKKLEDDIVIVPDAKTFSLIVYASKKNQRWIGDLIKKLDKRRPQVLIDVALVEITRTDQFEYDLNLIGNTERLVTQNSRITSVSGLLPVVDMNNVGRKFEYGWNLNGQNYIEGFYGEDKIQALIKAIDKKNYGRVLAQPKILVNDNEEGLINTTEKTYVKEDTLVIAGETGSTQQTTKWTEFPAKIELSITPNISEGDLLRLAINMVREDFDPKDNRPPDYRTSTVNTVVTVPDGTTIILGGLTKLRQNKGGGKVPIIGDIPLIGALFRSVNNTVDDSKLYIFVKANILRPDETSGMAQLRKISEENRAKFEMDERKFQKSHSIPGLESDESLWMEPQRVLGDI